MLPFLSERLAGLDWGQAQSAMGDLLGLDEPLPAAALRRALVEDDYCVALFAQRGVPLRIGELVNDPGNDRFELPNDKKDPALPCSDARVHSTVELMVKGGKALGQWTLSGFETVDSATFERRFDACQRCPELSASPNKWIYKVALSAASDDRICGACGCIAIRKARLPTEHCPRTDSEQPSLSRWGEPLVRASNATARTKPSEGDV
ncbi:hypothetical protein IVB30_20180 [Bradyrhizobium sp. 200]|uniref:hypothetical protein n=1 Tax=Bradyrhizobium sp. 200 TaxID=2782665 RepID=UPI001FFF3407|nr:hypothetical protein [Bradyrhizobium sp. 200]UPJ53426.1 hypothetical protein IVB30_20180 [Bradyrhizobium sp. 200]